MNKQEVYQFLDDNKIEYEKTEHIAVFNMEDLAKVKLPYSDRDAKNLFVRDDKKAHYYLITVKGEKRVDLKEFRKTHNIRPLTFASPDDLLNILKLIPGSVTPLGLLNDTDNKVEFFIDESLLEGNGIIGCHPNDNTATVWLKTKDLIALLEENKKIVHIIKV